MLTGNSTKFEYELRIEQNFISTKDSHFIGKNMFAFQDSEIKYRNAYDCMSHHTSNKSSGGIKKHRSSVRSF